MKKLVLLALLLSLCGTLGAAEQQYASASTRMAAIGTFTPAGGPNTYTQTSTSAFASGGGSDACAVAVSEAKATKPYVAVGVVGAAITASVTSGEGDAGITSSIRRSHSDGVSSSGGSGYATIGGIAATQTGNNLNGIVVSDGIEIDN